MLGQFWSGRRVLCNCNNQTVVAALNNRYSRESNIMHLLCCLFFLEAHFGCYLTAAHLPGHLYELADDLSCNHADEFSTKAPSVNSHPTHNPPLSSAVAPAHRSQLVFPQLDPIVQFYCLKGIAESTHKTYINQLYVVSLPFAFSFPVSEAILCYFSLFLAH